MRFREGKGVQKLEKQHPLPPTEGTAAPFYYAFILSLKKILEKDIITGIIIIVIVIRIHLCHSYSFLFVLILFPKNVFRSFGFPV